VSKKIQTLGDRIRQLRREKEWSQEKLAKTVGAHIQSIGIYEKDESIPNALILKKIADAFGVSVDYLISGESDNAVLIKNKELLKRVELLDRLNPNSLKTVIEVMDMALRDQQVKELAKAS
jgi:transcriptional regulator with XRE-family HTH domain